MFDTEMSLLCPCVKGIALQIGTLGGDGETSNPSGMLGAWF